MSEITEEGKLRAIIAHITIIGWIIAIVMNNEKKDEFASFYIRQTLGIFVLAIAVAFLSTVLIFIIPFLGVILYLGILVILIMSLVWAISGEKKALPIVGDQFQEWFKSL